MMVAFPLRPELLSCASSMKMAGAIVSGFAVELNVPV
jgi:hypothetical protein